MAEHVTSLPETGENRCLLRTSSVAQRLVFKRLSQLEHGRLNVIQEDTESVPIRYLRSIETRPAQASLFAA